MPVEYRKGNLFDYRGNLAHGVNCVGVMGKGIAVQFKKNWPQMFEEYETFCKSGRLFPGNIYVYEAFETDAEKMNAWSSKFSEQLWKNMKQIKNIATATQGELDEAYNLTATQMDFEKQNLIFHRWVYNLAVKSHWKCPSEVYMVEAALSNMIKHMEKNDVKEVAMPIIGCGLGGLNWETQVKPIVEKLASKTHCSLIVYLQ